MSEIEIPESAIRATYQSLFADSLTNKSIRSVLELGGPVLIATELRRMAHEYEVIASGRSALASWRRGLVGDLRARADELDPQGGAR